MSSKTIVQGKCPNDTISRNTRAKELGCENINNSCKDSSDFVYHCVLNEWGNGSLEVCAPSTKIIGQFCVEYNLGGSIVQEHHKTNRTCTSCPFVYNSTESFRYSECFKGLSSMPTGSTKQSYLPLSIDQWIGPVVLLGLILLIAATTFCVLKKRITSNGQHISLSVIKDRQNA
ncbi:uncharacterized protein LOC134231212 [Saccostrea cucullata]|uniref:uncharacterized protein LOC134231212 n=1 Tax=Saccostrea cuccullata TaxID=36930 RepID=UPI002ED504B0